MASQKIKHIASYKELAMVLLALFALTGITVAVSSVDLGFFNVPLAL
ncbi:MAG: caa(3)-type oxidase subunit 4, partial [Candidatus Electrothrix sp. AR3]|nr:caa(3)-type oxidase subunit 4 [Candidatus Electrothrix sp. AR3]